MTGGIGGTAVYLRGVLAREGTTTMGTLATIGVDDDLTACQTRVTVRTTDNKLTRGVHVVFDVETEEIEHLLRVYLLFHTGDKDIDYIVLDLGKHPLIIGVKLIVLC